MIGVVLDALVHGNDESIENLPHNQYLLQDGRELDFARVLKTSSKYHNQEKDKHV